MATHKRWASASAPVEGYIVPPGEGEDHPVFPTGRVLAGTASTGGPIAVEEAVLAPGFPGPYRHYHSCRGRKPHPRKQCAPRT